MMNAVSLRTILDCIDLPPWYPGGRFEVQPVTSFAFKDADNWQESKMDGPCARFRIIYDTSDNVTREFPKDLHTTQYARWWYIEREDGTENVIKTAWLALTVSDEYRRRQAFRVNDVSIFNSHYPIRWPMRWEGRNTEHA